MSLLALSISAAAGAGLVYSKYMIENKEINRLKYIWDNSIQNSNMQGIRNKKNETFKLKKIKKVENGFIAYIKLPSGLNLENLEKCKNVLETALTAKIIIEKQWNQDQAKITIINKVPEYKFRLYKSVCNKLYVGHTLTGQAYFIDLNKDPHIAITGQTGTGKSILKMLILINLLHNYKNDFDLYICQTVNNDEMLFKFHRSCKFAADNLQEAKIMLEKIKKIADTRREKYKKMGFVDFQEFNNNNQNKDKRIIISLEEFSFLAEEDGDTQEEKEIKKIINSVLKRIAKAGRAMGINIICALQRATIQNNLDSIIRSQLSFLTLRQRDTIDSNIVIGTGDAAALLDQEAILNSKTEYINLYIPCIPELKNKEITTKEFIKKYIPGLDGPSKQNKNNNNNTTDLIELTNKLRVPKEEQQWNLKDKNNIINLEAAAESLQEQSINKIKGKYDNKILKFIEVYECITIKQCTNIAYKNKSESQRRLKQLEDLKILKAFINARTKEKVYYIEKEISPHNVLRADFISKIMQEGAEIIEYKKPRLLKDMIRPDAAIKIKYNDYIYNILLEVDYFHKSSIEKIKLYEKYQDETKENFILIIMNEKAIQAPIRSKIKVKMLNFNLSGNILQQIIRGAK